MKNTEANTNLPAIDSISTTKPLEVKAINSWEKYFQENTLKIALSLMLFTGGLFVLIYFAQIEFLPEIDLANTTALLASVALVGLFSVLVLAVVFIAPGMILHQLVAEGFLEGWARRSKAPSSESVIKNTLSPDPAELKRASNTIERSLMLSSVLASGAAALLQIFVLYFSKTLEGWGIWNPYAWLFIGAVFSLICALLALYLGRMKNAVTMRSHVTANASWRERAINSVISKGAWLSFIALLSLWIIIGAAPLLPFVAAYHGPDGMSGWLLLFAWLVWIGFANSIWGCDRQGIKWWLVCAIALCSLYVLVITTSNPSFVSTTALRKLGLGGVNGVTLVINKQACQAIAISTGKKTCSPDEKGDLFITEKVNLLSRMGSQYLIEGCSDNGIVRIVLNKTDVISWSRQVNKQGAGIDKSALDCNQSALPTESNKGATKSSNTSTVR